MGSLIIDAQHLQGRGYTGLKNINLFTVLFYDAAVLLAVSVASCQTLK